MTRLIITPLAESDIEDIGDYIAQDHPDRAVSFVAELRVQDTARSTRRHVSIADKVQG
jgi:plasmid stabilization system protein ParE